jgi:hypothetical protein
MKQESFEENPSRRTVTLTAVADENWNFDGWSGDVEDDSESIEIKITERKKVNATFIENLKIGESYKASDGLNVTLNSFQKVERAGSFQYIINYTLENKTSDQVISEGQFKLFFANEPGGLQQFGFFGRFFPGDSRSRQYTFEATKDVEIKLLAYSQDIFFAEFNHRN